MHKYKFYINIINISIIINLVYKVRELMFCKKIPFKISRLYIESNRILKQNGTFIIIVIISMFSSIKKLIRDNQFQAFCACMCLI